jgi:hypothetical protein
MSAISKYKGKKKLRRIEITPAENGFTTSTYHDTQDDLGKGASIYDGSPEVMLHKSANAATAHIKQHLSRHAAENFAKGVM